MDKLLSIISEAIQKLLNEKGPWNIPSNPERGALTQSKRTLSSSEDAEEFFYALAKKRKKSKKKKAKTRGRSEDS